ncbi:MAG: FG-GAP-like repeat-containing protein [Pirellulales bacterium]
MRRTLGAIVVLLIAAACAAGVVWRLRHDRTVAVDHLAQARTALRNQRYDDALAAAERQLALAPDSLGALRCAAESEVRLGRFDEALRRIAQANDHRRLTTAADDASEYASEDEDLFTLYMLGGHIELLAEHAREAETFLRRAHALRPDDLDVNRRLVFLLTVAGRRWESKPFLQKLVRLQGQTIEELILASDLWPVYEMPRELERFEAASPGDPLPKLGLARLALHRNEFADAVQLLRQVVRDAPPLLEAHAWLGFALAQSPQSVASLGDWEQSLPSGAEEHPVVWVARALGAELTGQPESAARCYWEATRRDPQYESAYSQLARALHGIGRDADAQLVRARATQLYELTALLKRVHADRDDLTKLPEGWQTLRELTRRFEQLGRFGEAWNWNRQLANRPQDAPWAADEAQRLEPLAKGDPFYIDESLDPTRTLDLASLPTPVWNKSTPRTADAAPQRSSSTIRFVDSASAAGLSFMYFNADSPEDRRLLGTTGGGVGVLDFDLDGWPDIYLSQGCPWPVDPQETLYRDRLFRNLGVGKFQDVTRLASLGDASFSQGVAVGDWDNDGFPDLYLGNVGANRLYRNNGDGTFTEVAESAGLGGDEWTTSVAIADIDADGHPDLYDVNYLGGDSLTRICQVQNRRQPCLPNLFPAQDDRLWRSNGDGRFVDASREAGLYGADGAGQGDDGKGLGVVLADFDGSRRLGLFVANDGTANYFFEPQATRQFLESAVLAGLAYDRNGLPQACMGVAADDFNGDGLLDLFVTNFYRESNTLYVAEPGGKSYVDRTAEFGLRDGSLELLGFGTQSLDADLDGWPDLIITNGHVRDLRPQGGPYEMPAQFYRNLQGRKFVEPPVEQLGPFFRQKNLGRGLARLDWNRDGREDAVISHVDGPVALLTNDTESPGHWIAVRLVGVHSSRDAIGTSVEVETSQGRRVRQLTAGDGYQASNERQLVFGLGAAEQVQRLTVRWPAGGEQTFESLAVDARYVLVEGAASPWRNEP